VGTAKDKKGRKTQVIVVVVIIAICVGFAIYSYVWGRSYFQ